ncbi:hypothetical protein [Rugamonas aquatica]|uniref:Uncharacterized protein n=1 Tax=Rugamonas aquatica TaxID=2743357 RepID=A0A6A7MZ86_9BURK|nr:hypothetical protein [Rugamonas aquatica]MQA37968.1 hypothetical protein [Rugamonas aquatica]
MQNPVLKDAIAAAHEGRDDDALRLLLSLGSAETVSSEFMPMFVWHQLAARHEPSRAALVLARDGHIRRLLEDGDDFRVDGTPRRRSRFAMIVSINDTLKDSRSTYELFVQLEARLPELAEQRAFLALPAIVDVGDFILADRYLQDPMQRLGELNQLASHLPLLPPHDAPPRLAGELSSFTTEVRLRTSILVGLGQAEAAQSLRAAALAGLDSDEMRALATRELEAPGAIAKAIAAHAG